jgi:hypothetical protein
MQFLLFFCGIAVGIFAMSIAMINKRKNFSKELPVEEGNMFSEIHDSTDL